MKKLLRAIKIILVKLFKTKMEEFFWKFRHILDKDWPQSYISESSLSHPHRKVLIEVISKHSPFNNVLEFGCASGPNLFLLAKEFPQAKFYGIDISEKAIKLGNEKIQKDNITNIFLIRGGMETLKKFLDKSIDVTFTDACLIYFGPEKIEMVLKEMQRITKKALILCEMHSDSSKSLYKDKWIHNYKLLFQKTIPKSKIKFIKIPQNLWKGDWAKYGYIIEIIL